MFDNYFKEMLEGIMRIQEELFRYPPGFTDYIKRYPHRLKKLSETTEEVVRLNSVISKFLREVEAKRKKTKS